MKKIQGKSLLLLLPILFAASCMNNDAAVQPPVETAVTVDTVSFANTSYYESYPSLVKAATEVELKPQISGYITGIHFKEGDRVLKGQKLYTIDPQQSEAAYDQASANLAVQEANLIKARKDVERYRELDRKNAVARQQVDYAESNYEAAQKLVAAAKASVRGVQTNVRYSTIVAPFSGVIGISQVRLGAAVTAGQTLLNTISSEGAMVADIVVDQREIAAFTTLLNLKPAADDSTFRLMIPGNNVINGGRISFIDRAVDPQTGSIKIRFDFPNDESTLRPGMSGTIEVLHHSTATAVIPYKSVVEQLGEFFVYVADSSKATQRHVVLGKQVGKRIVVKEGLSEGDIIITEGIQNLKEGSKIKIVDSLRKN